MNHAVPTPLDVKLMNATSWVLLAGFVALSMVAAARWVSRLPVFDIVGITVTGDVTHNSVLNLRANVAPRMGGTFFTVDLARVRAAFESVPWVRKAVVQRDFPNRLLVTLQEHQPVAYWGSEGELRLINHFGEVFEASPDDSDNLPELAGPKEQSAQVWSLYQRLQAVLAPLELGLERLELTERGGWRAQLDNGAQVELGRGTPDELLARTRRFSATLSQLTERYAGALQSVDLRYPNGYALRLRGVTTVTDIAPNATQPTR